MSEPKNPSEQSEGRKLPVARPVDPFEAMTTSRPPIDSKAVKPQTSLLKYLLPLAILGAILAVPVVGFVVWRVLLVNTTVPEKLTTSERARRLVGKGFTEVRAEFGEPDLVTPIWGEERWAYYAPQQEGAIVRRNYRWVDVYFKEIQVNGRVRWEVSHVSVVENGQTYSTKANR